ncbi:MAG: phage head-tail connector protein [Clostridium sp.]|jgi:hypothetical protein|nr:phage head-tail connector protein [Clostridium sp.]
MTLDEKLTALRAMVGGPDTDEVLSTYLTLAGGKIIAKAFPYRTDVTEVPERYDYLHLEVAAYMLNKRGAEQQVSHSENGIARSWESGDVPSSLINQVTPVVGVL